MHSSFQTQEMLLCMDPILGQPYHSTHKLLNRPISIPYIVILTMPSRSRTLSQKQIHSLIGQETLRVILTQCQSNLLG
jgi:hypothetical protein